jgi:hypothetical protein
MKRLLRGGESGQVIVILAIGFIILLAFVGIVTDVSLLFVRYNTLRRAVDAASVAAAGQMRKTVPSATELTQAGCPGANPPCAAAEGYAAARNYASLNLAARQFIEFYGLQPTNVIIETCASRPGDPELCTPEQRKLVRVIAQVNSPTVFLRLLGWPTLTLEATAISETAVLDVVVIMDVSESMGQDTTYDDWEVSGYGYRYLPPRMYDIWSNPANGYSTMTYDAFWDLIYTRTQDNLEADPVFNVRQFLPSGSPTPVGPTRDQCQVAFFPSSLFKPRIPTYLLNEFRLGIAGGASYATTGPQVDRWDGFQTQHDYFGCCNDPDGNGLFADLVCQPFRAARDATAEFLNRIDFVRGDRVAFVTYDRAATIIDPDGTGPQSHMIDNSVNAQATLRDLLGVRATSDFYADTDGNGVWDRFVVYPTTSGSQNVMPSYFESTPLGQLTDYPVKDSCTFQNAVLYDYYSPFESNFPGNVPADIGLLQGYHATGLPGWPAAQTADRGYQRWAQCRGGNIGAALRQANSALTDPDTARTLGSVWVMVLLSDGAAGASDPVRRGLTVPPGAAPYPPSQPPPAGWQPYGGEYGAYGLCPYGPGTELGDTLESPFVLPYCSDELPETRHFCLNRMTPPIDPSDGAIYVDLNAAGCSPQYDVDDHARDWADMIGLLTYVQGGEGQLPTIFTIGFGLNFDYGTTRCASGTIQNGALAGESDVLDCLGEEMLRYIADVGDNFQLDTNYQQDLDFDGSYNNNPGPDGYGVRGPCENPLAPANSNSVDPLTAGENCGNYYNAPSPTELEVVFNDIASRMFTRLAR